jgi:hypothetical protein
MKKFLLLLVAVMSVCAAHAAHTVYFDNKDAGYTTPYCYAWTTADDNTVTPNHKWPGVEMTKIYGNLYAYTTDDEYANCIFSNNGGNQTSDNNWTDGYLYYKDGDKGLFSFYVNVRYASNGFADNGITADTEGFTTHSALPIGTGYFNIKTYNSVNEQIHYYTPGSIAQNEWVQLQSCIADDHMKIANAVDGQKFNVEYDVVNNKIRVTPYIATLYLRGTFSDITTAWARDEKYLMTTTDGITYTYGPTTFEAGLNFKIGSEGWNESWGPSDSNNSTIDLTGTSSKTLNAKNDKSSENFTVSQSMSDVSVTLNTLTKALTITGVITAGIDGVEAEAGEAEAEYFTVAGVRVDNPATPGLYLRRQGNKTSKVVIR